MCSDKPERVIADISLVFLRISVYSGTAVSRVRENTRLTVKMGRRPGLSAVMRCDRYGVRAGQGKHSLHLSHQAPRRIRKEAFLIDLRQGYQRDTFFAKISKALGHLLASGKKKKKTPLNIFML